MKELQFTVKIQATNETVWDTLWGVETFTQWASVIDPQSYMKGDLIEGQQVEFISAQGGYGVTSLVAKVQAPEYLLLKHQADTQDEGAHEREQEWTGGEESYSLNEVDGVTALTVTFGVPPTQEAYFEDIYPKALQKLKELAEKTTT